MSTSVTNINGLVVVTHVFPEGEKSHIPLMAPVSPCKSQETSCVEPDTEACVSEMTKRFVRCEPKVLGVVQILTGLMTVAMGLIRILVTIFGIAPLVTGAVYILSGSYTLASHKGTRASQIMGTLSVNLLSVLTALAGVGFFVFDLSTKMDVPKDCLIPDDEYNSNCSYVSWSYRMVLLGVNVLLLVVAALEAAVALTICIYSCKAMCKRSQGQPIVMVHSPEDDLASLGNSDKALLDN